MQNAEFDTFHATYSHEDMELLSNLLIPQSPMTSESASPVPQQPSTPDFFPDSPSYSHMMYSMPIKAEPVSPLTPMPPRVAQFPHLMPTVPVFQTAPAPALIQSNQMAALMARGARASAEALAGSSSSDEYEERPAPGKMSGRSASPAQNEEERIVRRRKKNREAAQQSRLRKRQKLESLESQLSDQRQLHEYTVNQKIALEHENSSLRKQVEYLKEVLRNCSMVKMEAPSPMGRVAV